MLEFKFDSPRPSQCDTCKNAYYLDGGSISMNNKSYRQRYCSIQGSAAHSPDGKFFYGIGTGGFNNCPKYEAK